MNNNPIIDVIIPAYNEENAIGKVIDAIPRELVRTIIVGNNGSIDSTKIVAERAGAIVVDAPEKGYGNACLEAIDYVHQLPVSPDILVFIDGDYADYPEQLGDVVAPIIKNDTDLVIGSRALGNRESGSMTIPQVWGNKLASILLKVLYGYKFTDLGPFRAIKYSSYNKLNMIDRDFGWTVEMQIKAAKHKMKTTEVPVNYKKRIGVSKVSGTIHGSVMASYKILYTIAKYL